MGPVVSVAEIARRYAAAREAVTGVAVLDADRADMCRYCGAAWTRWPGTELDGHAKCYVPREFQVWLRGAVARSAEITLHGVADAIGVSLSVLRSWVRGGR